MRTEHAELVDRAIELLEKANAGLQPELLASDHAQHLMARYARAEKLAAFGVTCLTRKVAEPAQVARVTGTSMGKAKAVVTTGNVAAASEDLSSALQHGEISLDQAAEIAQAEESAPGSARSLVEAAQKESFHFLRDKARRTKLEAEQHRGLAQRQHAARRATHASDELGMVHIHLALEPHVGTPITRGPRRKHSGIARAAKQRSKSKGNSSAELEPFERHLADAYAKLLSGSGNGRAKRPELVVLVSHEVAKRGWKDVKQGELCKIPGVGPVAPEVAKDIARDAFLNGVFYDGKDLHHLKRWSRHIPIEVAIALELGEPPDWDGIRCVDCGKRFRTEFDHVQPRNAGGPSSNTNLEPRCWPCHLAKTKREREAARKAQDDPGPERRGPKDRRSADNPAASRKAQRKPRGP